MYLSIYLYICIYIYKYMYIYISVYTYIISVCVCVCVCVYTVFRSLKKQRFQVKPQFLFELFLAFWSRRLSFLASELPDHPSFS